MKKTTAGIGFRSKTGKAIGIVLDDGSPPQFLRRPYLELFDPGLPETMQPHHEVMELPWPEAQSAARRYEELIDDIATERLKVLLDDLRSEGVDVRGVGVVGSPDRPLEKIGNRHMRAHAAEGILFRRAVEIAAERCGLTCRRFSDRGFDEVAVRELKSTRRTIEGVLRAIGAAAGRPWRIDERTAAMAAWIVGGRR